MTVVVSTSPLISGAVVCGVRGLGTKGSQIPSSGIDGPSPVYPSLNLPTDANKEYRVELISGPSFGNVSFQENTATSVTNLHDGSTSFSLRLYEDGVDIGTIVNSVVIGATDVVAILLGTETANAETGAVNAVPGVSGIIVLLDGTESSTAEFGTLTVAVEQNQSSSSVGLMLVANGSLYAIMEGGVGLMTSGEIVACLCMLGSEGRIMLRGNGQLIIVV